MVFRGLLRPGGLHVHRQALPDELGILGGALRP